MPFSAVNLSLFFSEAISSSDKLAPEAVISLLINCFSTVGTYFVAWVRTLNTTRVGFDGVSLWFLNSLPEPSVATAYLVTIGNPLVQLAPLFVLSRTPVIIISLGEAFSVLGVLVNFSEYVNP